MVITTIGMVAAMYVALTLIGWAVLAIVPVHARERVLPAAPVIGAAVSAAVASTATRWFSAPWVLLTVVVLGCTAVGWGVRAGHGPWRPSGAAGAAALLAPLTAVVGAAVVLVPTYWVGDHRPVAGTIVVDQFYFAATSDYLQESPLLPGPYWNPGDWTGSAGPSYGPVVDVIANRLRYGQASVGAMMSFLLRADASDTVVALSALWVVLVGVAVFTAARLLGAGTRSAGVAGVLATSSVFVTSQALEGKNDGLLGLSMAVTALGLTYAVMEERRLAPLVAVVVAGLAATYSELVLVLVPAVVLMTILRGGAGMLSRVNLVAGTWAAGAALAPFAWIWLAQSARIGGRFSEGSTPFDGKTGWELLRVALGVQVGSSGLVAVVGTVVAVLASVTVVLALAAAIWASPARGAALGLGLSLGGLMTSAVLTEAGNLLYRTSQFAAAFMWLMVIVGVSAACQRWTSRRPRIARSASEGSPRTPVVIIPAVLVLALMTSGLNAASAVAHLSPDRSRVQHIPEDELDEAVSWVREVGGENVSVVVPRFTDLIWLALDLKDEPGTSYPVVPAVYLGNFPRWDREPDRYHLVGVGARVSGEARVVHRNSRYRLVELGTSGTIVTPFQPTFYWGRTTFMRGYPCARMGSQLLLLRGSASAGLFSLATPALEKGSPSLTLSVDRTERVTRVGKVREIEGWSVATYEAPRFTSAILDLQLSLDAVREGRSATPVRFVHPGGSPTLPPVDGDLSTYCLQNTDEYMDGYRRNLTLMRRE